MTSHCVDPNSDQGSDRQGKEKTGNYRLTSHHQVNTRIYHKTQCCQCGQDAFKQALLSSLTSIPFCEKISHPSYSVKIAKISYEAVR